MKKILRLCMMLLVNLILLSVPAFAAETLYSGTCGGEGDGSNLTWTLDDQGTLTISGSGKMEDFSYNGSPWYAYRTSVKTVSICDGVTSIGDWAFSDCSSLTSVTIPEGVTSIGGSAFYDCSSLKSVTIPEGVTSIGYYAFRGCSSLTSVTIPESVTRIGDSAFYGCSSLTAIQVDSQNNNYSSDGRGVLFNKNKTTLIQYPIGNTEIGYAIPEGVTSIGDDAFYECSSLTSVTIPESVTSIGNFAFSGCSSLTSMTIPEGVTNIGGYVFRDCSSLTSVIIPDGVTSIGDSAFSVCSGLVSATIPVSVTSIGRYAFEFCSSLTSVTIPENVTSIGEKAFSGCSSLTAIQVDSRNNNYSSDERGALFDMNKTKLIQYPIGNTETNYAIPEGVTSIGSYAFAYCISLTSVTFPENVTSIGNSVFFGCSSLTSVTLPVSVTSIGDSAFLACDLKSIYYGGVKSQYIKINIGTNNSPFNRATVYYQGVSVTGVELNFSQLSLTQGDSQQLKALVLPENASDKTVTWSVSNSNVVSVTEGVVSALSAGTAEVTVTTADGGYTATCLVTVTAPPTLLNRDTVLILDNSGSMYGNSIIQLKKAAVKFCENVLAASGTNRIALVVFSTGVTSYDFSTDLATLAATINSISADGMTNTNLALNKANALISSSAADVKSVVLMTDGEPTCNISDVISAADSVKNNAYLYTLGFFHNLSGSSKQNAASLLDNIQNTGYYEVTNGDELDMEFENIANNITRIPVTGISLDKQQIVITQGESAVLNASLEPHDATDKTVYWSSSNPAVAQVSSDGTVTAVSEGKVTVTAVSSDGNFQAECTVIVNDSSAWYYTYTVKQNGTAEITGYRTGLEGDIVIPSYVNEYKVTSIGGNAFRGCNSLTSVTIPDGVMSIGDAAFQRCSSLASVTIPASVTSISNYTFFSCGSLSAIHVDDNNNNYSSDERGVLFNKNKTTLIQYPIGNTETNYAIPERVTSIGSYAFRECSSLTSVTIPEGVTSIGSYAFEVCRSLSSVTIPASVTRIGVLAFENCSNLTTIHVDSENNNYSSDERGALFDKNKTVLIQYPIGNTGTSYAIPESVMSIGNGAFWLCNSLTSVTIPAGVTSIGGFAFYGCSSLTDVYYTGSEAQWNAITFGVNNQPLLKATIHYHYALLSVRASDTASGRTYSVSACNLPISSTVMVALYSGDRFVGLEKEIYNGETLDIETQTAHDFAKIMAWESLGGLTPLTPAVTVSKE